MCIRICMLYVYAGWVGARWGWVGLQGSPVIPVLGFRTVFFAGFFLGFLTASLGKKPNQTAAKRAAPPHFLSVHPARHAHISEFFASYMVLCEPRVASFSPRLVGNIRRSARWLRRQRIQSKSSSVSGLETAGCSTLPGTAQPSNGSTAQHKPAVAWDPHNALVNPACRAPGLYNMGYLSILDQPVSLTLIGSAHAQSLLACMCCEKRGTNKYSVVYA